MLLSIAIVMPAAALAAPPNVPKPSLPGIRFGPFPTEIRTVATVADGLPSNNVLSVALCSTGELYAGTAAGLARFDGHKWSSVAAVKGPVKLLAADGDGVLATCDDGLRRVRGGQSEWIASLPEAARNPDSLRSLAAGKTILLGTRAGLFQTDRGHFIPVARLNALLGPDRDIRQVAVSADGRVAVAALGGLFLRGTNGTWGRLSPVDGDQSWLPRSVGGVAFDAHGRLWFGSRQGAGFLDDGQWTLYTGEEGLPYNNFNTLAVGENGTVWFGTSRGAIRFDGEHWSYREGQRWVPDDDIRQIAIAPDQTVWFATRAGLGKIELRMMTLAEKAKFFEDEIDKYHRRTPYGYVLEVSVAKPGDKSHFTQHDSDNDGLWTAMYGAGEAFAYAATKDPKAKERATKAFHALRFLSQVTQGGEHPAPKGFPARSILPTSGPDPNTHDSAKHDQEEHARDPQWKVISPRWPKSADGKWYWKSDTSSDELDGHFFCYATYYDLAAETEAEKREARDVIAAVTDHLITHDFNLVDHDGKPTRWGVYDPKSLNLDPRWAAARGLNSLSILSYLRVALHATGDKKYAEAFERLVSRHGYLNNISEPKPQTGPSTGNHSDDEMAFMDYYDLLKYEQDPKARRAEGQSLYTYWTFLEQPERNPLFNYIFAASFKARVRSRRARAESVPASCLSEALDQLERFPLDRFNWAHRNSPRTDIVPIDYGRFGPKEGPRGHLHSGRTVSVDEHYFNHWNYDPWSLNTKGDGKELADGAVFLLPYYMGLYHGFIIEEPGQSAP